MNTVLSISKKHNLTALKQLFCKKCQERQFATHLPMTLDHWIPSLKNKSIPVVLLQDRPGYGVKGQIVYVKRGHARYNMVPAGHAVVATWENIDTYVDPNVYTHSQGIGMVSDDTQSHTFDWIKKIRMKYILPTYETDDKTLLEPISIYTILEDLSTHHELDMLPSQVSLKNGGDQINQVGEHMLLVNVPLRVGYKDYAILVEVVSDAAIKRALQRKKEIEEEIAQRKNFNIQEKAYQFDIMSSDSEEEYDMGDAQATIEAQKLKAQDETHDLDLDEEKKPVGSVEIYLDKEDVDLDDEIFE